MGEFQREFHLLQCLQLLALNSHPYQGGQGLGVVVHLLHIEGGAVEAQSAQIPLVLRASGGQKFRHLRLDGGGLQVDA